MQSKLPQFGTTIFTVMSALAKEHNAINLSQGFPDFDCDNQLKELACRFIKKGYNQYPPMRGCTPLLEQIAIKYHKIYNREIDPLTEVTITAGAAEAIYSAITAIVHPGDEVIIIDPAYDLYKPATVINGGIPVIYTLRAPDFKIDWQDLKSLVTSKTKLIVINTPHNPIGKILTPFDLRSLENLVEDTGIYVISDEVYEHLVFDGRTHESILKYPGILQRGIASFSFGKTYHITGWRVGYCIAPKAVMEEFRKIHQFNVFTVPTPLQYALAEFMKDESHFTSLPSFFEEKRNYLQRKLAGSKFTPLPSEGSYFQLYDYSQLNDKNDQDMVKDLTINHGVAAIPLSPFYNHPDPDQKLIRLCFCKEKVTLAGAAERLSAL